MCSGVWRPSSKWKGSRSAPGSGTGRVWEGNEPRAALDARWKSLRGLLQDERDPQPIARDEGECVGKLRHRAEIGELANSPSIIST
jgi:hypothetical protein